MIQIAVLCLAVTPLVAEAQTVYQRQDGGVTVVEQGKNVLGQQTTEVRRYNNQSDYVAGEYATEIALAQIALQIAVDAAPHVEKAWNDFKRDFQAGMNDAQKGKPKPAPMFPLVKAVDAGSLAQKIGIKAGDYLLYYNDNSLGWATTWNNPLKFKIDQAREAGGDGSCELVILRGATKYVSKVPRGAYIGVSLGEGTPPSLVK